MRFLHHLRKLKKRIKPGRAANRPARRSGRLEVEGLEARALMAAGLTASLELPVILSPKTVTLADVNSIAKDALSQDSPRRPGQLEGLDRLADLQQVVERMLNQTADGMQAVEDLIAAALDDKTPAEEGNPWVQSDVWSKLMENVQAELERMGLGGAFGDRLSGHSLAGAGSRAISGGSGGDTSLQRAGSWDRSTGETTAAGGGWNDELASTPIFQDLLESIRGTDPTDALLGSLAASPISDFDVAAAKEVLSVPGLETFHGQDVFSMSKDASLGILASKPGDSSGKNIQPGHVYAEGNGVKVVESDKGFREILVPEGFSKSQVPPLVDPHTGKPVQDLNSNHYLIKDAEDNVIAYVEIPDPGDKDATAVNIQFGKNDAKKHELPEGVAISYEPIDFDPRDVLDQLSQPGVESEIDYSMLMGKFVRGVVAGLMSKINPSPEGGQDEGEVIGNGELAGINGGDPWNDMPTTPVTQGKGPKPIGDPDSPTGPGGPLAPGTPLGKAV